MGAVCCCGRQELRRQERNIQELGVSLQSATEKSVRMYHVMYIEFCMAAIMYDNKYLIRCRACLLKSRDFSDPPFCKRKYTILLTLSH